MTYIRARPLLLSSLDDDLNIWSTILMGLFRARAEDSYRLFLRPDSKHNELPFSSFDLAKRQFAGLL